MNKIVIVGSGISGLHFALSVLEKGYSVTMLDVGYEKSDTINPEDNFNELKRNLCDPVDYFLGPDFQSVIYPDDESEFYGFPPNKQYIFKRPPTFTYRSTGFKPLFSFARGGLAETWTGGVYPFTDLDLQAFPFDYNDIEPYYGKVADRIGITGVQDDLVEYFPFHKNIMEPLVLDQHSEALLEAYAKHKQYLNEELRCFLGRSRVTALSQDKEGRRACTYCGRCIWGCPPEALYTPSITLAECLKYSSFQYVPNMLVSHFEYDTEHRIQCMVAERLDEGMMVNFPGDIFVMAAGTLSSSKVFMDSVYRSTGETIRLCGLMDNRQLLVPFVNLRMIGKGYNPESYQYHQLAMEIEGDNSEEYIHGQITTLKTAIFHPIIQSIPLDTKSSISIFRNIHAALGVININLQDRRRDENSVSIERNRESSYSSLVIQYSPPHGEKTLINKAIKKVKKALWKLGCVAPTMMIHVRPMGASVHYAGTIPMSTTKKPCTASEYCQSHDFENLYFVDGTTFPYLPAKNLTFTMMANAVRIADRVF